jgi:HPt (histidine-containing phosphotransfer) domain-containing protein
MAALPLILPDSADRVAAAIATSFDGDAMLYHLFAADCKAQFLQDLAAGESAFAAGELAALGRLVHDLRSVLRLLGQPDLSQLASQVEQHAKAGGDRQLLAASWRALSVALRELLAD